MDSLLLYLLKVSVGTVLLYLTYIIFFSKDTFYLRNRIFLLGFLALSIFAPFLDIFHTFIPESTIAQTRSIYHIILPGNSPEVITSSNATPLNLNNLIIGAYVLITGFFLTRIFIGVAQTLTIIRNGTKQKTRFPKVVVSQMDHPPFSFFPYVVIQERTVKNSNYLEILAHETAHVKQGHTFDLLFSELLSAFLWFNPFMWLLKKAMVQNHEYLADNYSLKNSCGVKEYQYKLLNTSIRPMNIPLAHNFSSLIKNRIVMINKKPTRNFATLKNIIILPLVALMLVMSSFKPASNQTGNQNELLSKDSKSMIFKFIASKAKYPSDARSTLTTGQVFVLVKMNKGGIIKECKAYSNKEDINVPHLTEIEITGYKPSVSEQINPTGIEQKALKDASILISKRLSELQIPEWQNKKMEFAITYTYLLE